MLNDVAPLPDEAEAAAAVDGWDRLMQAEPVEGMGEFVKNWWPEGGMGGNARD